MFTEQLTRPESAKQIQGFLEYHQVVAILGARQVGKTTLARQIMVDYPAETHHFDLENPDDLVRLNQPKLVLEQLRGLVVIDEVQRVPELFPLLRVLADRPDVDTRFLLLGSASPELLQQSSESLAGRIAYHDLTGFNLSEVGADKVEQLWWRGGFPRAFLAPSERSSNEWRRNFIRTFLDRDLPQLGVRVPAATMHRFWQMLAHYHGQILNGAELARAFGVAQSTVRHYLDILSGALVVRQLLPWYANLKKRQVKSSKVYLADTGLLHGLLGLKSKAELLSHPKVGASWEGFVISEVLAKLQAQPEEAYFWSTHAHAELDLLIARGNNRLGFEDKETLIKSTVTANCCVMRCSECSHMPEYAALSALGKPFIRLAAITLYSTQRFTQSLPELSSLYVKVSTKVLPIVAATVFSLYGCGGGGGSSSNNNNGGDPVDPVYSCSATEKSTLDGLGLYQVPELENEGSTEVSTSVSIDNGVNNYSALASCLADSQGGNVTISSEVITTSCDDGFQSNENQCEAIIQTPLNCEAGTQVFDGVSYSFPQTNHNETSTASGVNQISNGYQNMEAEASCSDGSITLSNSNVVSTNCDSGFENNAGVCSATIPTYNQQQFIDFVLSNGERGTFILDSSGNLVSDFSHPTNDGNGDITGYAFVPKATEQIADYVDGVRVIDPYSMNVLATTNQDANTSFDNLKDVSVDVDDGVNNYVSPNGTIGAYIIPNEIVGDDNLNSEFSKLENLLNGMASSNRLSLFAYGSDIGYRRPIGEPTAEMPGTVENKYVSTGENSLGLELDKSQILIYTQEGVNTGEVITDEFYTTNNREIKFHEWTGDNLDQMFNVVNLPNGEYNLFMKGISNEEDVLLYIGSLAKDPMCNEGLYLVDPNDEGPTYDCTS